MIQRIFHSLVSTLFFYLCETKLIACLLLSSNCSTDSSPQNVLTCNIALGQEARAIYTVLNRPRSPGATQRARSYVDSRSQAFSDSRAWIRKARSYIG